MPENYSIGTYFQENTANKHTFYNIVNTLQKNNCAEHPHQV